MKARPTTANTNIKPALNQKDVKELREWDRNSF